MLARVFRIGVPLWMVVLFFLSLAELLYSPQLAQANTLLTWQDTGLPELPNYSATCFDALQPNVLLVSESRGTKGTFAYNWVTGQRTLLYKNGFDNYYISATCSENTGLLFQGIQGQDDGVRYSSADPQGVKVAYVPTHLATDGTLQMYSLRQDKLLSSSDGGLTWLERGQQFHPKIADLLVSDPDARAIYIMVVDPNLDTHRAVYTVYFSPDVGATWEKRYSRDGFYGGDDWRIGTFEFSFWTLDGRATSTNTLMLASRIPGRSYESGYELSLSNDGGRTFNEVGKVGPIFGSPTFQLFQNSNSFFRIFYNGVKDAAAANQPAFARSDDGGKTWQALNLPVSCPMLLQPKNAPASFFLVEWAYIWYSSDLGQSWQKLAENQEMSRSWGISLRFTPYAPVKLLGFKDNRTYLLDLPDLGKSQTQAVKDNNIPSGKFFDATGHNLSGVFKAYWEQNGGLAQFGYPKTEPFREVNPSDGKVYTVQYFERNRFEYHPENKGTKYEVLLGLLGNQLTETRRAKQEQPFQSVANPGSTAQLYFPETGHTLSLSFKKYWEQNGGLSFYGYPISEEFQEINPDDGFTYTVQYFERNRFEYHPENKGTKYEVILGLLGNTLLKQKDWL